MEIIISSTLILSSGNAFNLDQSKILSHDNGLTLHCIDTYFDLQQQTTFENIVGKEEIARNGQFLLFPQCFRLNQIIVSPFVHIFDTISLFAPELEEPKIGISGKGLMKVKQTVNDNNTILFSTKQET